MALRKVSYFGGFRFFSDWLNNGNEAAKIEGEGGLTEEAFKKMMSFYTELSKLNEQMHEPESKIAENLKELFA